MKPHWHQPLPNNKRELPGLGSAFLQHLGAASSMVVSRLLSEPRSPTTAHKQWPIHETFCHCVQLQAMRWLQSCRMLPVALV